MATGVEKLQSIEINKELSPDESKTIESLDLKNFDNEKGDQEKLKEALKKTDIKIEGATKPTMKLLDIANDFDQYVKKGEGWKLKLKDENDKNNPEWIKNIIKNPANNDLAYLVQKLSGLIKYQTAKAYTENELNAVEVKLDKKFGNQTKNALAGLKNWVIDSEKNKTFISKDFLKGIVSGVKSQTDEDIKKALESYHVTYDKVHDVFAYVNGYDRIDKYGNNLATKIATKNNTEVQKEKTPDIKTTNEQSTNETSFENDLFGETQNTEVSTSGTTVEPIKPTAIKTSSENWRSSSTIVENNNDIKDIFSKDTKIIEKIEAGKKIIYVKSFKNKIGDPFIAKIEGNKIIETGRADSKKREIVSDLSKLDITFTTQEEAICMANFINYLREKYKGEAGGSTPFNRGRMRWGGVFGVNEPDLEFDEKNIPIDTEVIHNSDWQPRFPSLVNEDNKAALLNFLNGIENWEIYA